MAFEPITTQEQLDKVIGDRIVPGQWTVRGQTLQKLPPSLMRPRKFIIDLYGVALVLVGIIM